MRNRIVVLLLSFAAVPFGVRAQLQPNAGAAWFKAINSGEGVWTIGDNGADNMYLVEGRDRALLIDTGLGVARLSAFLKTLTAKPVVVVNTHGHPDHAGGNFEFKAVYAHAADFSSIRDLGTKESRMRTARNMTRGKPGPGMIPVEEAANAPQPELMPVRDGYVFDLGGRRLEVIEAPGHTPGEIVLLDAAHRALFTGDNSNALVWLFLPNSRPLEVYLQSLKKLQKRIGEFTTVYPGHGTPLPNSFIGEQIACVEGILDGSLKSEPQHYFAGDAMVARYKTAAVAYNPQNLRGAQPPAGDAPDPAQHPVVLLWPGGAPGSEGKGGEEQVRVQGSDRIVSGVHRPSLTVYLPSAAAATGAAVIVAPGGSYRELWITHEGYRVAEWLSEHGIAGFVLKYRLPREAGSSYTIEGTALADIQRAIRVMRARAAEWRIDPRRTGVMGFSAGAHLAGLAAARFSDPVKVPIDDIDRQSARPDFQALIYPPRLDAAFSKDTPPAFLACGGEDRIADGVPDLYRALKGAGVPAELHIYAGVGHGFGIRAANSPRVAGWIERFREWLSDRGLLAGK